MTLRVLTYLAPSIPLGLFELVIERLRRVLGVRATLRAEARHSGPPPDIPDPFSADEADLAFLCSPSFAWLSVMRPVADRARAGRPRVPRATHRGTPGA